MFISVEYGRHHGDTEYLNPSWGWTQWVRGEYGGLFCRLGMAESDFENAVREAQDMAILEECEYIPYY